MNYEQKYNEALKWVQKLYPSFEDLVKEDAEHYFPELTEDEDDKIKKEIIDFLELPHPQFVGKRDHEKWIAWLEKQGESKDKGEISDGYHTFNELYRYRMLYNAAFFNMLPKEIVHKSKRHHDGEECFGGGWFVVMANLPTGQISNHYELKDWDLFQIPEKEIADEWDGHTPQEAAERLHRYLLQEAAERLHKYLLEKQGEKEANQCSNCINDKGCVTCVDGNMKETIKSKFKEGDFIVPDNITSLAIWKVINIDEDGYYKIKSITNPEYDEIYRVPAFILEKDYRLWTINDAKDGDALVGKDGRPFIFTGEFDVQDDNPTAYCGINSNDKFITGKGSHWTFKNGIKPATKEQRELLFQKMKEAEYEWRQEEKKIN